MPATLRQPAAQNWTETADRGPLDPHYWIEAGIEPALAELLADPIMHAVMRADGVPMQEVLTAVSQAGRRQRHLTAVALR